MLLRRSSLAAMLACAGAIAIPASASAAVQVDVSIGGGDLNIHAQSGTTMGMQVQYLVASDEWQVIGNFATAGSGCTQESSAVVECGEGGEDIDADFADLGGGDRLRVQAR